MFACPAKRQRTGAVQNLSEAARARKHREVLDCACPLALWPDPQPISGHGGSKTIRTKSLVLIHDSSVPRKALGRWTKIHARCNSVRFEREHLHFNAPVPFVVLGIAGIGRVCERIIPTIANHF